MTIKKNLGKRKIMDELRHCELCDRALKFYPEYEAFFCPYCDEEFVEDLDDDEFEDIFG
jgi:hypothetical protein